MNVRYPMLDRCYSVATRVRLSAVALLYCAAGLHAMPAAATNSLGLAPQGQVELVQKREQKLKKPVFKQAAWHQDLGEALAAAKRSDSLVLVYFTRSYAPCEPCEAMESGLLASDEFVQWSKKVTLCIHVTSRIPDLKGDNLLYEFGGNGFPTLSLIDASGNLLQQLGGGEVQLDGLTRAWQKLQTWQALRAAVVAGKSDQEPALFAMELAMGNRPYAEMVARAKSLAFEGDSKKKVEQQLVNLEFTEVLRKTPRDAKGVGPDKAAGGALLLVMFEQGRYPDCSTETSYWEYLLTHAGKQQDAVLFERMLNVVKQRKKGDARLTRYLNQLEAQLEVLKGKKG
ncbi:MAG: thioredoxin family protein [Planctomycetes bacterium]|nr:thioredoxin family protein [Planctomycetota bacterium]